MAKEWERRIGSRLKLRDLYILSAAVEWGSMGKAASQLAMSQPAVSEAIADLEGTLGVRLLDRSSRGVKPTVFATALLRRGQIVFDELRQGVRDIEFLASPAAGEVRIGCPESLTAGFLPAVIDRLSRRYPQIVIHSTHVESGTTEFRELRERNIDLMLDAQNGFLCRVSRLSFASNICSRTGRIEIVLLYENSTAEFSHSLGQ